MAKSARSRKAEAVVEALAWAGQPNQIEFVYELGEASECDVFELAPMLTSIGNLIRDSHRRLNPEGPDVVINVRPFEPGSFDIPTIISYSAPLLASTLFPANIPHTPKEIYETLKHLGLIAVKGYKSVRAVIEALGGKPEEIKKARGGFTAKRADKSQNVNGEVGTLIQDNRVYQNIYNMYAAPIERGRSKTVRTYAKNIPADPVRVSAAEVPALKEAAEGTEVPTLDKEKTKTRTIKAALHPKRGSFNEDGHQWSFQWGEQTIVATIRDKRFLKEYAAGGVRLNGHDTLHVTLIERQRLLGEIVQSTTYEIRKVNKLDPGPKQQMLLDK